MTEFNLAKTNKALADAEKALAKAQAEYEKCRVAEDKARVALSDLMEAAAAAFVPADPALHQDLELDLRQAIRERALAQRPLTAARERREKAFRAAVAKEKPNVQRTMNDGLERIVEAGEALKAALDDYAEYDRAWHLETAGTGAVRADPPGDLTWRILQLNLGRVPTVGEELDKLSNRYGRKPYHGRDAA